MTKKRSTPAGAARKGEPAAGEASTDLVRVESNPATEQSGTTPPRGPDPQLVANTAHEIWKGEGRPEGRAFEHWIEAEKRVRKSAGSEAKSPQK